MKYYPAFIIYFLLITSCTSDRLPGELTGPELIEKSIAFHDPRGSWKGLKATFVIEDSLPPPRSSRSYSFSLDNTNSIMSYNIDGISYRIHHDSLHVEMGEIALDRALRSRDYYTFLWGLPMKLQDEGTNIGSLASMEILKGKEYHVVRVPYEKDVWYFYLEPETYRMAAYKFYQDEPNQKGEIVYLEGMADYGDMRIPANRSWYRTDKPEFLGTDKLISIQTLSN